MKRRGFPALLCLTTTGFAFILSIYTQAVVTHSSPDVSGLAEEEFMFSTAAVTVLRSALLARRVLITHWCLGTAEKCSLSISTVQHSSPSSVSWGQPRCWEETQLTELTQID